MDEKQKQTASPRLWDPAQITIPQDVKTILLKTCRDETDCDALVRALVTPQRVYSLRMVDWKVPDSEQFLTQIREKEPGARFHPSYPNILLLPVHGPQSVQGEGKTLYVKEDAAEKVLIGANLFVPGVDKSRLPAFQKGDQVSLVSKATKFVVADGIMEVDNATLVNSKRGLAVRNTKSIYTMFSFRDSAEWQEGKVFDQSVSSFIAGRVTGFEATPTSRIADLCAAPGGKTTAIAQTVWEQFHEFPKILALDRSRNRCQSLERNLVRLSIPNVTVVAEKLGRFVQKNQHLRESFDNVTLDPPCSGLGTRPKFAFSVTPVDVEDLAKNQNRLIHYADELLRPGGTLVYSTCTLTLEENEGTVATLLANRDYEPLPIDELVGRPGIQTRSLSTKEAACFKRIYPHEEDTVGFFIAKLRKKSS